jgi:phosphoribosylanthranilate isomerase
VKTIFEGIAPNEIGVKICGITNPSDVELCVEAGANALGFNFYPGSKRYVELEKERNWLEKVSPAVFRVAVVVNPTAKEALGLLAESFIDALQLHGDETLDFCDMIAEKSGKEVIKAVRVRDAESLEAVREYAVFPVLLDAFAGQERGGTGQTFDWKLLAAVQQKERIILSGGLNPENINSALRLTKLRYVDVASGVEENPRCKSAAKVRKFLDQVRETSV